MQRSIFMRPLVARLEEVLRPYFSSRDSEKFTFRLLRNLSHQPCCFRG